MNDRYKQMLDEVWNFPDETFIEFAKKLEKDAKKEKSKQKRKKYNKKRKKAIKKLNKVIVWLNTDSMDC